MKPKIIIHSQNEVKSFDAVNALIEITNEHITYRMGLNNAEQLEIIKVTANGLDTIVIQPANTNKIIIF